MSDSNENYLQDIYMPLPGEIWYHYTDINGLYGILNEGKFYATDYRFLNDKSEITYTFDLLREILIEKLDLIEDIDYKATIERLISEFESEIEYFITTNIYIISFSKNKDSLSLWSNYSNKQGYNIGIDITNTFALTRESDFFTCEVIYDRQKQKELILIQISKLIENLNNLEFKIYDYINKCISDFLTEIYMYSMYFKDELFKCEEECRVIYIDLLRSVDVMYRPARNLIVPYIKIPKDKEYLPIKYITIGPTNHSDIIFESIKEFVKSKKYIIPDECIKKSDITLRF